MFGRDIKTAMVEIFTHPELQFRDIPRLVEDPYLKDQNAQMKVDVQVVMAGFTKRDLDYKEKAFDAILEQIGMGARTYYVAVVEDYDL